MVHARIHLMPYLVLVRMRGIWEYQSARLLRACGGTEVVCSERRRGFAVAGAGSGGRGVVS
jgi:hypothetical protein